MGNDPETIDSLMMQGRFLILPPSLVTSRSDRICLVSRIPKIMVDATVAIISSDSRKFTGNQLVFIAPHLYNNSLLI